MTLRKFYNSLSENTFQWKKFIPTKLNLQMLKNISTSSNLQHTDTVAVISVWLVVNEGEGGDGVGSVSGGGRYDELVGMFSPKGKVKSACKV